MRPQNKLNLRVLLGELEHRIVHLGKRSEVQPVRRIAVVRGPGDSATGSSSSHAHPSDRANTRRDFCDQRIQFRSTDNHHTIGATRGRSECRTHLLGLHKNQRCQLMRALREIVRRDTIDKLPVSPWLEHQRQRKIRHVCDAREFD